MKVVKVIPLSQALGKEHLTYFTARDVTPGDIVTIPLRSREINGFVLEATDAEIEKADLKSADFSARKVINVKGRSFFSNAYLSSISKLKEYFISTTGAMLDAVVPEIFFKHYSELVFKAPTDTLSATGIISEKLIHQAPLEDRISFYKTYIRESFARKSSVFMTLPTRHDISLFADELKKGIENHVYVFHSDIKKKEQIALFNRIMESTHPVFIIATPRYICIPRHDIKTIIIERESSSAYRELSRPYADMRIMTEVLAREMHVKLIFADTLLRTETIYRHDQGELGEVAPPSFRIAQSAREIVVDTRKDKEVIGKKQEVKKYSWKPLSDELIEMMKDTFNRDGSVALFSLRKGLAPVTACNDCGTVLTCPRCESALVLYGNPNSESRVFVCNKCGEDIPSDTTCTHCGSWHLVPLGIGTERIRDEIKRLFPDTEVFILDKEHAKTYKKAQEIAVKFSKSKRAVIVGTELLFFHLKEKVRLSALVSFDSLFSIPSYRINEKILYILLALKDLSSTNFLIQTKYTESDILRAYLGGNLIDHFREEVKVRKALRYPPFSTLIKLTVRGSETAIEKVRQEFNILFRDFGKDTYSSIIKHSAGALMFTAIIKIPRLEWTLPEVSRDGHLNSTLSDILRGLPPYVAITIDPEDVV